MGSFALLLWSMLALLSRAATDLPPFQLTAIAFSVTAWFGLIWLWSKRQLDVLRQPPLAWLHGAGGLFGYHALFFTALKYAPATEANLLNYAWPFLIVILSAPILGLHLTRHHILEVTIGLGGSVLLLACGTNFGVDAVFGYACAIGAAFAWAMYSVLAVRFRAVPTQAIIGCRRRGACGHRTYALRGDCHAHSAGNGMRPVAWHRAGWGCVSVVGYRHEAG
jgi:drug/metabolite transporter (DMT)-like permease